MPSQSCVERSRARGAKHGVASARVVTGNGPGGVGAAMPAASDLYRYFGAEDRKLVIMTVDEFNGNVLDFYNDQQALSPIVPKSVVQEIGANTGTSTSWTKGLEAATVAASAMAGVSKGGGVQVRPRAVAAAARVLATIAVISGGFLFGAASRADTVGRHFLALGGGFWLHLDAVGVHVRLLPLSPGGRRT